MRKLFKDEYGFDRDWFIIVKGGLFILGFGVFMSLVLSAIYSSLPQPYQGNYCYCDCQDENCREINFENAFKNF